MSKQKEDKILFIMPSINRKSIVKAVQSLYAQTDQRWHLCIVYDCIDSKPIIPELDEVTTIMLDEKKGKNKNNAGLVRNVALDRFVDQYERIAFLDDDDILNADYVELVYNKYNKQDLVIFKMSTQLSDGQIIEVPNTTDITKLDEGNVGISFCYKTEKLSKNRFIASDCEDWIFVEAIIKQKNKYECIITQEIGYNVRKQRPQMVLDLFNNAVISTENPYEENGVI